MDETGKTNNQGSIESPFALLNRGKTADRKAGSFHVLSSE